MGELNWPQNCHQLPGMLAWRALQIWLVDMVLVACGSCCLRRSDCAGQEGSKCNGIIE